MATTLSLSEKLDFIPALLSVALTIAYKLVSAPFRGSNGAKTLDREISNAVIRKLTTRLSVAQLQYVRGTSTGNFDAWASSQAAETRTVVIGEGAKLHWIGTHNAGKTILHFHGGGYILPLSGGHLKFLGYLRDSVQSATGGDVSIAALEYTTAPQARYPTQFRQANAALHHLISSGISPDDIILSGDSAGGHLALCLVSHLLHPHPLITVPPNLSKPLAGILLISPRVTNTTTAASFSENSAHDTITKEALAKWIAALRVNGTAATDEDQASDELWTEPLSVPVDWWADIPKVCRRAFISAGNHECFRDNIVSFSESWRRCRGLDIICILEDRGIHDSPLMDAGAGRPPTDLMLAIGHWLVATVEGG